MSQSDDTEIRKQKRHGQVEIPWAKIYGIVHQHTSRITRAWENKRSDDKLPWHKSMDRNGNPSFYARRMYDPEYEANLETEFVTANETADMDILYRLYSGDYKDSDGKVVPAKGKKFWDIGKADELIKRDFDKPLIKATPKGSTTTATMYRVDVRMPNSAIRQEFDKQRKTFREGVKKFQPKDGK